MTQFVHCTTFPIVPCLQSPRNCVFDVVLFSNLCCQKAYYIVKEYNQQNASDLFFCLHIVYGNDTAVIYITSYYRIIYRGRKKGVESNLSA